MVGMETEVMVVILNILVAAFSSASGSVAKWQGVGLVILRQPKTRGFKSRPGLHVPFSYPFRLDYFFPAVPSSNSERIYWKIHRHCQYDF